MGKTQNQGVEGLVRSRYYSRRLFTSSEDLERVDPPLAHCHTVRRAFGRLRLDAVLYVDRAPTAYFKRVKRFDAENIRQWHTYLWNQHVVPLLVIISDTRIKVYSGHAVPTDKDDDIDDNGRLVDTFEKVADVLELDEVLASIETGEIFRKPDSFNRKHAVDRCLLQNLTKAATDLTDCPNKPFTREFAHLFLTRLLFACYLIERKMIKGTHFPNDPVLSHIGTEYKCLIDILNELSPSQAKEALFRLFDHLKAHFNGSLLDTDLKEEKKTITDDHIRIICSFLNGDDLRTGQFTLSFWAYDFSTIPIETISAIYQGFISEQGNLQETSGAYYTPPHLAELTVDILLEDYEKPLYESKVLDPACGSGVFLVSMFNRMANQWMARNGNHQRRTKAKELLDILQNRLFGIDVNETACHITCFSLYLAVLDQLEPWDVEKLEEQGLKLPPLLSAEHEGPPNDKQRTIVCGNVFDPELNLYPRDFDFVIGNPPWVSRDKCKDKFFLDWRRGHEDIRGPQKQIAHGFMWKAPEYLNDSGKACLLLPTAVLLSKTDRFQVDWFSQVSVERVINFSDLRFVLFAGATHPGIVLRFNKTKPDIAKTKFRYASPKVDIRSQVGGAVYIDDEDIKTIRLSRLLAKAKSNEASKLWKTQFWGTWRDLKLVQRLSDMRRLIDITGTPGRPKRFIKGQGFKPYLPEYYKTVNGGARPKTEQYGDPKRIWWRRDRLYVDAENRNINLILTEQDCTQFGQHKFKKSFTELYRSPDARVFCPPMVLINHSVSRKAFCDFPVVFRHALQSICGKTEDTKLLMFLAAVLNTHLADYYFFHTSASFGIERDQVYLEEVGLLPFPLPDSSYDPERSRRIIEQISEHMYALKASIEEEHIGRDEKVNTTLQKIRPLVYEYYDIDKYEQMLIEDTVDYIIPSITPRANPRNEVKTLTHANERSRKQYTETLCKMLNIHARKGRKVEAHVLKSDSQAVVVISRAKGELRPYHEKTAPDEMRRVLNRIDTLLPAKRGGFVYYRNLKIFDKDHIYIVKPLTLRSWMRTTALNDADEVASAVLRAGERR
jgi:type I restriction-modification system DNA methylase subunit